MDTPFKATPLVESIRVDALYTLHYFEYARDYLFTGEKHDFWEMAYIDKGEAGVMADNTGFQLKPGEAIFHRPNEYHNIWANGTFTNVVIVSFSCNSPAMAFFQKKILQLGPKEKEWLAMMLKEGQATFKESLAIVDLTGFSVREDAPFGSLQLIKILLEQLLISLMRDATAISRESRQSADTKVQHEQRVVEQINQYLEQNLSCTMTLDEICSQLLFSKTYLKQIYKKWTGDSIMHHFLLMKMNAARRLISEQQYTFTEIAQKLGFCSVHHFSRTFSRLVHLTPSEYARSVQSRGML